MCGRVSSFTKIDARRAVASRRRVALLVTLLGAVPSAPGSFPRQTFSEDGPFMCKERHDPAWLANPCRSTLICNSMAGARRMPLNIFGWKGYASSG